MTQILDVFGLDASDDVMRTVALALPVLVLLTLIVLLIRGRRRVKAKAPAEPVKAFDDRGARSQSLVNASVEEVSVPSFPVTTARLGSTAQHGAASVDAAPRPAAKMPPAPQALDAIENLQAQLNNAMKSPPNASLAPLFLDMARHHKASGDESSYLAALRSAAGLAAQHGPRSAHAEARLELAEAAFKSGDLIGACEQWQIARVALQDDGQKDAYAVIDKRMRDNGCPTDWVLTDF